MLIYKITSCCMISALLLVACDKGTTPVTNTATPSSAAIEEQPTSQPSAVTSTIEDTSSPPPAWAPSDDPTIARFLNYVAPKSATWIEHPPSGMGRIANYTVPDQDGNEAAQIIAHYFGQGQGGNVQDNIINWQRQFKVDENGQLPEPIVNRFEVNSFPVTTVEISGQWQDMGAAAYKSDQLFIAVIVEIPQGNLFIKFVGQTATVSANKEEFLAMIKGIHEADQE